MSRVKQNPQSGAIFPLFLNAILEHFSFLVNDFGFQASDVQTCGRELILEFRKPPVGVLISQEPQALPVIRVFHFLERDIIYHDLESLSRVSLQEHYRRLPRSRRTPEAYASAVGQCLQLHADLLRQNGQRFLLGDPSELQGIQPGQFRSTK